MAAGDAIRVLIIEADSSLAVVLTDLFNDACHRAEAVPDAASALRSVARTKFDLIILDAGVADNSGFDICRQLRGVSTGAPILILGTDGEQEHGALRPWDEAVAYLAMPFYPHELLASAAALVDAVAAARATLNTHNPEWAQPIPAGRA
jgi:DNA-binding response OmpR family regulator